MLTCPSENYMKKYTAAVFDLDGTLTNTLEDLKDSVNYMLSAHGYPERSLEEIRNFVGNGVAKLVSRSLPEGVQGDEFAACLDDFKSHYSGNSMNKTRPYDGVLTVLEALKAAGIPTAVVSNKIDEQTKAICAGFFGGLIDYAVGQSDSIKPKPAPDAVFTALCRLGVKAEEAVYIGDSEVDFATAQNSGLDFIGAAWGFRGRSFLENLGAGTVPDSPLGLLDYFAV